MLNPPNYKLLLKSGWVSPIKFANFMPNASAGRLIYHADHRVKTDMRMRMQERTHAYRHNLHKRLREAEENREENEQESKQLEILEEYAAMVEGALNLDSLAPFQYGGLAMQEALTKIETSLEKLEKGGGGEPNVQEASQPSQNHRQLARGEKRAVSADC